jgi:hypothetical protein
MNNRYRDYGVGNAADIIDLFETAFDAPSSRP